MLQTGFSNRRVAGQMRAQHSVIDRLRATGMVERPRSGRPRNTTSRYYKTGMPGEIVLLHQLVFQIS